ncbi:MAG: hypothetical protein ACO3VI_03110 [Ilumatobacteraceae bacterium]|jgi:hypothetical protein
MVAVADTHAVALRSAADLVSADHVLPVAPALSSLFPESGLVRGRVISCCGPAARSLALAIAAAAVSGGCWLAIIDLEDLPAEALAEAGVPPHRVVSVSAGSSTAEAVGAALDGFELIIIGARSMSEQLARRVAQRIRSREAVVVVVGNESRSGDLVFSTVDPIWTGIGRGTGRLVSRRVRVERSGRRTPRPITCDLHLPATSGGPGPIEEVSAPEPRLRTV